VGCLHLQWLQCVR